MTTGEFLLGLRRRDIEVWLDGDRVRCTAPTGTLTVDLRAELARRRPEIEVALRAARAAAGGALVPIERSGSRIPFYAVPGHNGDVFCFVRLARCLGRDYPFYGLEPPGLRDDTPPLRRIEDLAAYFVEQLTKQHSGPYQIGGYCLGGLTAFEMARQLRARGHEVRALVLFGTTSPAGLRRFNRVRGTLTYWLVNRIRGARTFMAATPQERVRYLREKIRKAGRLIGGPRLEPLEASAARRRRVQAATLAAAYRYRPQPYDGSITMFAANEDATRSFDRPLEWTSHARGGLDLFCGPADCDGDSMLKEPSAQVFAEQLARRIDAVSADQAAGASGCRPRHG